MSTHSILSHLPEKWRCKTPIGYDLAYSEAWEEALRNFISHNGIPAYRPRQAFIDSWDLRSYRRLGYCPIRFNERTARMLSKDFDPTKLRRYQIDVMIKLDQVRRAILEVKTLTPIAFNQHSIHIGQTAKYDSRWRSPDYVILINSGSGDGWVCPPMAEWLRKKSLVGSGVDYAVLRSSLTPIEAWIDFIRETSQLA